MSNSLTGFMPGVLFDLDGTLVDSAGDLTAAANDVRASLGLPKIDVAQVRTAISVGARAILNQALPELDEAERKQHVDPFLVFYRERIGRIDGLFPGISHVLDELDAAGTRWGVVTNKREDLARIVLARLNLTARCAVLIGGDTLARCKPDPLPVLTACERMGLSPKDIAFVGDDARDVKAGAAAGARTIAVCWGFNQPDDDPNTWGADIVLTSPMQLIETSALHVERA